MPEHAPDWNALVRERLNLAEFSPAQQEEIVAELASHLDDLYIEFRAQGKIESEAAAQALGDVPNWRGLAKSIHRGKREVGMMNDRTKHLWLPGLASVTATLVLTPLLLIRILPFIIPNPRAWLSGPHGVAEFRLLTLTPWLVSGAVGAFLSRQGGGERFARLASGIFPVAVILAAIFEQTFDTGAPWPSLVLSGWTPAMRCGQAAALWVGALPFLLRRKRTHDEASHG